jgi:hypothetical protein
MPAKTSAQTKHELAEAVFRSVYASREQRGRRIAALLLLALKHSLRGLLFSWPVYLLAVAGFYAEGWLRVVLWAIAVPGMGLSFHILQRGIREEYRARVHGQLLKPGDLRRLLKGGLP